MRKEAGKEDDLLRRLSEGDQHALSEVFEAHARYCTHRLCNETSCAIEIAKDIYVDAVMKLDANARMGKMEFLSNCRAYLYRICYQMYLTEYRNRRNRWEKRELVERYYYADMEETEVAQKLENERRFEVLNSAIKTLGDRCRQILSLFYSEGKDLSLIAELMGLANARVVATTKSRCMKQLVEIVQEKGNGHEPE